MLKVLKFLLGSDQWEFSPDNALYLDLFMVSFSLSLIIIMSDLARLEWFLSIFYQVW